MVEGVKCDLTNEVNLMKKIVLILISLLVLSCGNEPAVKKNSSTHKKVVEVPNFNSDSAYDFIAKQVTFEPFALALLGRDFSHDITSAACESTV